MRTVLLALVIGLSSCSGNPPPSLSPVGITDWKATRVVKALDLVRDFAHEAHAQVPPVLTEDTTRKVNAFHRAAVNTIGAAPGGWKAIMIEAIKQLERDVLPDAWAKLKPYITLARTLIEEVTQ